MKKTRIRNHQRFGCRVSVVQKKYTNLIVRDNVEHHLNAKILTARIGTMPNSVNQRIRTPFRHEQRHFCELDNVQAGKCVNELRTARRSEKWLGVRYKNLGWCQWLFMVLKASFE